MTAAVGLTLRWTAMVTTFGPFTNTITPSPRNARSPTPATSVKPGAELAVDRSSSKN
jgi:hypothetical protein